MDFEQFIAMLESFCDSGVGTDACSYSFWANAPLQAQRALYDAYIYLGTELADVPSLREFLLARMIFIPKGENASDLDGCFARKPGKTRPLTLSKDRKSVV